ncbi:MAG: prolipoprotein diacylglyceryl transferase [Candidatus Limnocylindrales bacterium]
MIDWTPSATAIQIGPLAIPWYGIGYAVAIGLGFWLSAVQARRRGLDTAFIGDAMLWVVVLGVIGARLYHVIDQWQLYQHDLLRIVLPPYSGLALYGGVGGGILGLVIAARRRRQSFFAWADVAIPSLFFGQAIARWGNFFNQELYGPPTNLPWGIAIDCAHRVAAYPCSTYPLQSTGFQPLFFYEATLTVTGGLIALWASRRLADRLRDGDLLSFWFIWYGAARAVLEPLRSADSQANIGIAVVIAFGAVAVVGGALSIYLRHRGPRRPTAEPAAALPSPALEAPPAAPPEAPAPMDGPPPP